MTPETMDALVAIAEPRELPALLRSLTSFELTGMSGDEADTTSDPESR